jgi:hypothetical protein
MLDVTERNRVAIEEMRKSHILSSRKMLADFEEAQDFLRSEISRLEESCVNSTFLDTRDMFLTS